MSNQRFDELARNLMYLNSQRDNSEHSRERHFNNGSSELVEMIDQVNKNLQLQEKRLNAKLDQLSGEVSAIRETFDTVSRQQ